MEFTEKGLHEFFVSMESSEKVNGIVFQIEVGAVKCDDVNKEVVGNSNTCRCKDGYEDRSGICYACPIGKHSSLANPCTSCKSDEYSGYAAKECAQCRAGEISSQDRSHCVRCTAGSYESEGECKLCSPGKKQPNMSSTFCVDCEPGYVSGEGQLHCAPCGAGSYSVDGQACENCISNTYSESGSASCVECNPGYIAVDMHTRCRQCDPGYIASNGTCTACPVGKMETNNIKCEECEEGTYSDSTGSYTCKFCDTGKFSAKDGQSKCESCKRGTFANTTGSKLCKTCPKGKVSLSNAKECISCSAGSYSITPYECAPCPKGKFASMTNDCVDCPIGTFSDVTGAFLQCSSCISGRYAPQNGMEECLECPSKTYSFSKAASCESCPSTGVHCTATGEIELLDGYWVENEDDTINSSSVFHECPEEVACTWKASPKSFEVGITVAKTTLQDYVKKGLEKGKELVQNLIDKFMAEKVSGRELTSNYQISITDVTKRGNDLTMKYEFTPPPASNITLQQEILSSQTFMNNVKIAFADEFSINVTNATLSNASMRKEIACMEGYEGNLCASCADGYKASGTKCQLCWAPWVNWLFTSVVGIGALSVIAYIVYKREKGSGKKSEIIVLVKILISYMQVLSLMSIFRAKAPKLIQGMMETSSVSNGISFGFYPIACATDASYYFEFYSYLFVGPLITLFALGIKMHITSDIQHNWRKGIAQAYVLAFFLLYAALSKSIFSIFNVYRYPIHGRYYLVSSLDTPVDSTAYSIAFSFGILGLVWIVVGTPVLGAFLLYRNRQTLSERDTRTSLGFLYNGYKEDCYMWEILVIFRKAMISFIGVFVQEPFFQQYSACIILVFCLIIHVRKSPYKSSVINLYEGLGLFACWLTQMGSLLYWYDSSDAWANTITVVLLLIHLITIIMWCYLLLLAFRRTVSDHFEQKTFKTAVNGIELPSREGSFQMFSNILRSKGKKSEGKNTTVALHTNVGERL